MVHRNLVRIAAGLFGIVTLCLYGPGLDANQASRWDVVVAANAFVAHGGGTAAPVAIGAGIVAGDRITTNGGGALVLSRGEDLVTMAENSEITITDPQPMNGTLIQQSAGDVQYHVTKGPAPHFEVDTPLLATVVKGTTFRVSAGAGGSSVAVSEGRVAARDRRSGSSSSVGAGERGSVDTGHGGVAVHALASTGAAPASPAASAPASGDTSDSSSSKGADNDDNNDNNGKSSDSDSGSKNSGSGSSGSGGSGSGGSGSGSSGSGNGNGSNGNGNGGNGNGGDHGHGHGHGNGGHGHGKD